MRTNEEVSEQTLLSLTQTILSCVSSCLQRGEYYYMWFRIKRIKKNQIFQFGTHIGSSHVLVMCSFNIIITFDLKKNWNQSPLYLFSICAICKFWNWRIGFIEPREEDPLAMTSVRNYFDGKNIRKLRLRRTDSGDDIWKANLWELPQRKRKKAPTTAS